MRLTGRAREQSQSDAGLILLSVEPDGPADKAGALIGDVLLSLGGAKTRSLEELLGALSEDHVGKPVTAQILRAGELRELHLTIGERQCNRS